MIPDLRGWRTLIVNTVLGLVPLVIALVDASQQANIAAYLPKEWMLYYSILITLVNGWLRTITTTPVGKAKK